jgi:hypothetical protein
MEEPEEDEDEVSDDDKESVEDKSDDVVSPASKPVDGTDQ